MFVNVFWLVCVGCGNVYIYILHVLAASVGWRLGAHAKGTKCGVPSVIVFGGFIVADNERDGQRCGAEEPPTAPKQLGIDGKCDATVIRCRRFLSALFSCWSPEWNFIVIYSYMFYYFRISVWIVEYSGMNVLSSRLCLASRILIWIGMYSHRMTHRLIYRNSRTSLNNGHIIIQ